MLSNSRFTSESIAAPRHGVARSRNRGTGTPYPPLMAGRIEDALSGRILRGNAGRRAWPRLRQISDVAGASDGLKGPALHASPPLAPGGCRGGGAKAPGRDGSDGRDRNTCARPEGTSCQRWGSEATGGSDAVTHFGSSAEGRGVPSLKVHQHGNGQIKQQRSNSSRSGRKKRQ